MTAPDGRAPLRILGGGPAGLAAAHYAHARGLRFTLHEAGPATGGNCRTLNLGPCRYDTGAHRLHARDPEAAALFRDLLGDDLAVVNAPSRIVRAGRTFAFPPEPRDLLRGLTAREILRVALDTAARAFRRPGTTHPANFRDLAVMRYGTTLADLFLLGYTRKLWGRDPALLSPAVAGGRLDGLNLGTLTKTLIRSLTGPGAGARVAHLDGAFLYPPRGIGALFEALTARLPAESVHPNERISRLRHEDGRIVSIRIERLDDPGRHTIDDLPVTNVVSTLPLPALLRALDPAPPRDVLARADRIAFRNLILCVLRLGRPRFTPNASLYFPDGDIPFTRLYEPKNRGPLMAPQSETCLVLEIPCDPDDQTWRAEDATIVESTLTALERAMGAAGAIRADVLETSVQRISHAYPVLERSHEDDVAAMLAYCNTFANLRLAGRNALFRYAHIHDMFRQGKEAVGKL